MVKKFRNATDNRLNIGGYRLKNHTSLKDSVNLTTGNESENSAKGLPVAGNTAEKRVHAR